jgi:hypothetical protein
MGFSTSPRFPLRNNNGDNCLQPQGCSVQTMSNLKSLAQCFLNFSLIFSLIHLVLKNFDGSTDQ